MLADFFSVLLYILVQIYSKEHPDETEQVDFEFKPQGELEEDQVDGERWVDARGKIGGEDRLNCAMRGHDPEDFSQYSAQQSTDEHENEQNPV
jgi:hypothetical protein